VISASREGKEPPKRVKQKRIRGRPLRPVLPEVCIAKVNRRAVNKKQQNSHKRGVEPASR